MNYALGIDVGATNVKTAAVTLDGEILERDRFETADSWPDAVRKCVERIERRRGPARSTGIACPGLAAGDTRSIAWMRGRMSSLEGFDWSACLTRETCVLNDAHAALLGEHWLGAARGMSHAVLLTLGTGVGGAILTDGRLLRGGIGRAGHLGHISLNPNGAPDIVGTPGSLEDAIGDCTVSARSGGRFSSTAALLEAVRAGDAGARAVWLDSVRALAAGIASILNVVDPEIVLLGGGIAAAGAALFDPLNDFLDQFEWRPFDGRVKIAPAILGEHAGAVGAARFSMSRTETE